VQNNLIHAVFLLHFASEKGFMATCDVLWLESTGGIILERTDMYVWVVCFYICGRMHRFSCCSHKNASTIL